MGQRFNEISPRFQKFIEAQALFFVGTAGIDGEVNISPKGMDSLRVLDANRVIWLNVTGSGNESAVHVQELPRMTLMFTAFSGPPMILRLYGRARVVHHNDPDWAELSAQLPELPGARQIFDLSVTLVQSSCGFAVPFYDYVGERDQLLKWTAKHGQEGIERFWREKNDVSLDGKPSGIVEKNL